MGGAGGGVLNATTAGLSPESYARWRDSRLGMVTERLERDLVLELAGPLAGRRVLDVGCGDGTYALAAAGRGAAVTCLDASPAMLAAARQRARREDATLQTVQADAGALPFADGTFDVVTAVTVLCFVEDAPRTVREMARVLAPGGRLVLGELNRWSAWAAWRRVRAWLGSRTWRSARFRTPAHLCAAVQAAGLEVERVAGAAYYPPVGLWAGALARLDHLPQRVTSFGAAFVAVSARKPEKLMHEEGANHEATAGSPLRNAGR